MSAPITAPPATSTTTTVSLFGATGGTGLILLRQLLSASVPTTVLVRSSSKLLSLLNTETAPPNLHILTGSITDATAVRPALLTKTGDLVDVIFSTVGIKPNFKKLHPWEGQDAHLCETSTEIIVKEIESLVGEGKETSSSSHSEKETGEDGRRKPLIVALSTTGIAEHRDVPLAMLPFYHFVLATPHGDKKGMEVYLKRLPRKGTTGVQGEVPPQEWVAIRPSFLEGQDDPEGKRSGKTIRVGVEKDGVVEKKEMGYFISRADVAGWMFDELVVGFEKGRVEWSGKAVSLTW